MAYLKGRLSERFVIICDEGNLEDWGAEISSRLF